MRLAADFGKRPLLSTRQTERQLLHEQSRQVAFWRKQRRSRPAFLLAVDAHRKLLGKQLVEYDPKGEMVWSWDDAKVRPQGMETLLVLDNLDPAVLNDDRDGVLKPQP